MEGMSWIMVPSIQSRDGMTSHHHSDDEIKGPSHWLSSLSHKFNCSLSLFLLILRAVNLSLFSIPCHFLCSFRYLVLETLSSPFSREEKEWHGEKGRERKEKKSFTSNVQINITSHQHWVRNMQRFNCSLLVNKFSLTKKRKDTFRNLCLSTS